MWKKMISFPFVLIIYVYRYTISPLTPTSCRHLPTCSEYAIRAFQKHGPLKGSWLSIKRLSKCHPWGTHGYDPVPEAFNFRIGAWKRNKKNGK